MWWKQPLDKFLKMKYSKLTVEGIPFIVKEDGEHRKCVFISEHSKIGPVTVVSEQLVAVVSEDNPDSVEHIESDNISHEVLYGCPKVDLMRETDTADTVIEHGKEYYTWSNETLLGDYITVRIPTDGNSVSVRIEQEASK